MPLNTRRLLFSRCDSTRWWLVASARLRGSHSLYQLRKRTFLQKGPKKYTVTRQPPTLNLAFCFSLSYLSSSFFPVISHRLSSRSSSLPVISHRLSSRSPIRVAISTAHTHLISSSSSSDSYCQFENPSFFENRTNLKNA